MKQHELRISGVFHQSLKKHLFRGDGKESVAVLICGRYEDDKRSILLAHKLHLVPDDECERDFHCVNWKTASIVPLIEEAANKDMAILKIHSHPGGLSAFSKTDDISDNDFFKSLFGWTDSDLPHGSAIMLPDGEVFGRVFYSDLEPIKFDKVSIAGSQVWKWYTDNQIKSDDYSVKTVQAFGEGTYNTLKRLKVGVVGCSGTGSPTIEQLHRLGVGHLVLVDQDVVEHKNLNRILYTTRRDANRSRHKTEIFKEVILKTELDTEVTIYTANLFDSKEALNDLITCDIVFGCVDSIDGRNLIGQLTNFYLQPYIDMGIKLDADGKGGIDKISGSVHYIQPGRSSLMSRGVYTAKELSDHSLNRTNPEEFKSQLKRGYVRNVNVENPAVISMNFQISSIAVNEFLNRIHPYKENELDDFAKIGMDFSDCSIINESEDSFEDDVLNVKWAGRGTCKPFLRMMELEDL